MTLSTPLTQPVIPYLKNDLSQAPKMIKSTIDHSEKAVFNDKTLINVRRTRLETF